MRDVGDAVLYNVFNRNYHNTQKNGKDMRCVLKDRKSCVGIPHSL